MGSLWVCGLPMTPWGSLWGSLWVRGLAMGLGAPYGSVGSLWVWGLPMGLGARYGSGGSLWVWGGTGGSLWVCGLPMGLAMGLGSALTGVEGLDDGGRPVDVEQQPLHPAALPQVEENVAPPP